MTIKALNLDFIAFYKLLPSWQELMLSWRNQKQVRLNFLNSEPLTLTEYRAFLSSFAKRSDDLGFLVLCNAKPCGVVRATLRSDLTDGSFECGLFYQDTSHNLPALAASCLLEFLPSLGFKRYQAYFRRENLQSYYFHVLRMGHPVVREDALYFYVQEDLTEQCFIRLHQRFAQLRDCDSHFWL